MVPDYLTIGCCPIASIDQTIAYLANTGARVPLQVRRICGCVLPASFPAVQGPFDTPENDYNLAGDSLHQPWWVDPNAPESFDFCGVLPFKIEGWESTEAREWQPGVLGGRAFGQRRQQGRDLTVTAYLVGKNCTAVQYGFTALTERLLDEDASCGGAADLWMLQSCIPPAELNPDRFVAQIPGIRLTSPPKVIATYGRGQCTQSVPVDPPIAVVSAVKVIDDAAVTFVSVYNDPYAIPTGDNRRLMVYVALEAASAVEIFPTTITLGGVPLTEVAHEGIEEGGSWDAVAIWYLDEDDLPVGTQTLEVTINNGLGDAILGLVVHAVMMENVAADAPQNVAQSSSIVNNIQFEQAVSVPAQTGWVVGTIIGNRFSDTPPDSFTFAGTSPTVDDVTGPFGAFGEALNTAISHIPAALGTNTLQWTTTPATGGHDHWSAIGAYIQQYITPLTGCVDCRSAGCRGTATKVQWTWSTPRDEIWSGQEVVCADEDLINDGTCSTCRTAEWLSVLLPNGDCTAVCTEDELPDLTCWPIPELIPFAGPSGTIVVTSLTQAPTLSDELTEFVDTARIPVDAKAARLEFSTNGTAITADLNNEEADGANHQWTLSVQTAVVAEILLAIQMASTEIQTTRTFAAGVTLYTTLLEELRNYTIAGGIAGATFDAFIAEIEATVADISAQMVALIDAASLVETATPVSRTVVIPTLRSCYCPPLTATFATCLFDDATASKWTKASVVLQLYAGSSALKNVRIRAYTPLDGVTTPTDFTEFDASYACEDPVYDVRFGEPGLPAGAWLSIDPITRTSTVLLSDGRCLSAVSMLEGPNGAPIVGSLDLDGCTSMLFVITAPCGTATDATYSIKSRSKVRAAIGF